jgi:transcription elongation factor GreA
LLAQWHFFTNCKQYFYATLLFFYLKNVFLKLPATLHALVWRCIFFTCNKSISFMNDVMYVSRESFEKMLEELHHMKTVQRPAASRAIAEAREKGDLKENAEYDAAKEAQGILEAKIAQLEGQIASARIVDANEIDTSKVSILTKVTITNMATKKTVTYQIVGEKEADLKQNKISSASPIGKGLLGKQKGEVAEVKAPTGILRFKVENITI